MKHPTTLLLILFTTQLSAQSIIGAWGMTKADSEGVNMRVVVVFSEGYQVMTILNEKTGAFVHSNGGSYNLEGSTMTETIEFDTDNPNRVGQTISFDIENTGNTLSIVGDPDVLTRIDDGGPGALAGAWLMSGRKRDGEIQSRDTNRPRKTMKILTGTRFQWIAYDTEKKTFSGTGGGTYTTVDGVYTENIEFFSRDVTRVGASLNFDFELVDGAWHHSGLSSKGSPIYEIWSLRKE